MAVAELIAEIIMEPEKGFGEVLSSKRPILFSLIVVIISLFCQSVAVLIVDHYTVSQVSTLLIFGYIVKLLSFSIFWIIITSLFHFIASWHKTEGSINNLFILFGVSLLPLIFLPAVAIFGRGLGSVGHFIYLLSYFGIVFWILFLQIKSLKLIYHLETGKAISVYVIPFFSSLILFVLSLLIFIILIVALIINSL